MKAKHLDEATKLVKELKFLNEHLSALDTTDFLEISFPKSHIVVLNINPQFIKLKAASKLFLDLPVSNIHRRIAQIGLSD